MNSVRLAIAVLAPLMLACVPCNSVGCDAGFVLEIVGQTELPEGSYELDLQLEGDSYALVCTVGAITGPSACSLEDSPGPFAVDASVIHDDDDGTPLIIVRIVDRSESDGSFLAYRGPTSVELSVAHEGTEVAAVSYDPQYSRIEHRGSPECGYCDEMMDSEQLEIVVNP